jgi:hypothetical protein
MEPWARREPSRERTVVFVNPDNFHRTTAKNKQINAFTVAMTLAGKTLRRGSHDWSTCDETECYVGLSLAERHSLVAPSPDLPPQCLRSQRLKPLLHQRHLRPARPMTSNNCRQHEAQCRLHIDPRGDLDGFVLTDGTDVHLPLHLSVQLAAAVRPGDSVLVRGGPPPPGFGPPPPSGVPTPGTPRTSLNGRVQTSIYGPAGDLNGAVLEDGTIVRLPPPTANQSASLHPSPVADRGKQSRLIPPRR